MSERTSTDPDRRDTGSSTADVVRGSHEPANWEIRKLELERYKAQLDYRKFVLGSVFAAIAIAAIPPLFQLATAVLEYVKSQSQLRLDQHNREADLALKQQQFQEEYVTKFLTSALSQDIELRIRFADYFAFVSAHDLRQGWIDYRDSLRKTRTETREKIDLGEMEVARIIRTQGFGGPEFDRATRNLNWLYNEVGYVALNRSVGVDTRASEGDLDTGASLSRAQNPSVVACAREWDAHKGDSAGFVIAVAKDVGISLTGSADEIVTAIQQKDWQGLPDGATAAEYAAQGYLVIGGLRGSEQQNPMPQGHVVVVVPGPLSKATYPTAWWGSSFGMQGRNVALNWAWGPADRDKVVYSAKRLQVVGHEVQ